MLLFFAHIIGCYERIVLQDVQPPCSKLRAMTSKAIYRTVGKRHTARPRRISTTASRSAGGFSGMLAQLGLASMKLSRSRKR
jgi:hypothetical protein